MKCLWYIKSALLSEKNNLAIDLDIGSDLAELKANLAKFKKGKHGKSLDDIDIEQLDWVTDILYYSNVDW